MLRYAHRDVPGSLGLLESAAATDPHPRVRLEAIVAASWIGGRDGARIALAGLHQPLDRWMVPVTKQIRDNFVFGNYRLLNTYVGRVANNGSLEYKSVSSLPGPERELDSPSFLEWQLNGLRSSDSAVGNDLLLMQMFRFGARVPIKITATENGKTNQAINYESVGLNVSRLSVASNSPTLIGTITLPRTAGTVFLVLAVRPV